MEKEVNQIQNQEQQERGASMLEYALLAALIAVALIAGIGALQTNVSQSFSNIGSALIDGNSN